MSDQRPYQVEHSGVPAGGYDFTVPRGGTREPLLKTVTGHVDRVFNAELRPYQRITVALPPIPDPTNTPNKVQAAGFGPCNLPDGGQHPVLVPYLSSNLVDEYGFTNDGAPVEGDPAQMLDTSGQDNTLVTGVPDSTRQNPYVSGVVTADGLSQDHYGTYDYNGKTAPGTASRVARKPRMRVNLGPGLMFGANSNHLLESKGGAVGNPTATGAQYNSNDRYVRVDLAMQGGNLDAGLILAGDDANGLQVNVGQPSDKTALTIESNLVKVLTDDVTVTKDAQGRLTSANGTGLAGAQAGKAIIFNSSGSFGSGVVISVELADRYSGLCEDAGSDQNGLAVNLASAAGNGSAASALGGARLPTPRRFPRYLPGEFRPTYADGWYAYHSGAEIDDVPHEGAAKVWWQSGFAAAESTGPPLGLAYAGEVGTAQGGDVGAQQGSSPTPSGAGSGGCGVIYGSGLTVAAGSGDQLAVYLAPTPGLTFGGPDGQGLMALVDNTTIGINDQGQLYALGGYGSSGGSGVTGGGDTGSFVDDDEGFSFSFSFPGGEGTGGTGGARVRAGASDFTTPLAGLPSGIIGWDAADFDTGSYWSAAHPERLTASADGLYFVHASVTFYNRFYFDLTHSYAAQVQIFVNGGAIISDPSNAATDFSGQVQENVGDANTNVDVSVLVDLKAGDYVSVSVDPADPANPAAYQAWCDIFAPGGGGGGAFQFSGEKIQTCHLEVDCDLLVTGPTTITGFTHITDSLRVEGEIVGYVKNPMTHQNDMIIAKDDTGLPERLPAPTLPSDLQDAFHSNKGMFLAAVGQNSAIAKVEWTAYQWMTGLDVGGSNIGEGGIAHLTAGSGLKWTVNAAGDSAKIEVDTGSSGGSGGIVTSVNGGSGDIHLLAGQGISVLGSGDITISNTGVTDLQTGGSSGPLLSGGLIEVVEGPNVRITGTPAGSGVPAILEIAVPVIGYTGGDLLVDGTLNSYGDIVQHPIPAPFAASTDLTLALQAGTELGVGAYEYVYTRLSAGGESAPSRVFTITTTTGNQEVTVHFPDDPQSGVTGRRLYRTPLGQSGNRLRLVDIPGAGATDYVDHTPDGQLGTDRPPLVDSGPGKLQAGPIFAPSISLDSFVKIGSGTLTVDGSNRLRFNGQLVGSGGGLPGGVFVAYDVAAPDASAVPIWALIETPDGRTYRVQIYPDPSGAAPGEIVPGEVSPGG